MTVIPCFAKDQKMTAADISRSILLTLLRTRGLCDFLVHFAQSQAEKKMYTQESIWGQTAFLEFELKELEVEI